MRAPNPGGAAPQREMNAPRATQPDRGPRAEGPARGAEGPPRGVERNRQAEPQQPNRERQRATEREQNRAAGQRAEQQRNAERERSAERARSAERERSLRDQKQAEQQRNAERERNAERARSAERERSLRDQKGADDRQRRSAEQPDLRRDRQAVERGKGGERLTERRENLRVARERLGPPERQRLHAAFDYRRARVTNARFDRQIGHRVPRHVHLFPVPREVISFFPYYRDYRYVVVDDDICIVDPRTYEIVDVIDQGYYRAGPPRPEVAGLSLTSSQVALVRDSIPRDFPETPLRLRLALGAEIPGDVELYEFPVIVLDRVPSLRDYRFLVTGEQIVIVDPRDRSIALVVDRV